MHGIAGRWSSQYHAWYCGTVELAAKLCRGRRALYLFPPSGTFQLKWLAPDSTTTAASIATNKNTKLPIKPPRSSKRVYFLKQVTSVHTGNNSLGWDRLFIPCIALDQLKNLTTTQTQTTITHLTSSQGEDSLYLKGTQDYSYIIPYTFTAIAIIICLFIIVGAIYHYNRHLDHRLDHHHNLHPHHRWCH